MIASHSQSWQVVHRSKRGVRKIKVCRSAECAARIADKLFAKGISSTIEPCRTDVYVASECGKLVLVASRMIPVEASRLSYDYSTIQRSRGLLLWPHGTKLPKALQNLVVVADESEVES